MKKELISIIVPVYNVEKYIDRCMESLLNQTYTNLEIILIDDGSPDNCSKKCDDYAKIDERIKVIHKHNEGLGLARNSGLEIASGKYIAFVDSDDYVTSDMCEILYNAAYSTNADIVYGNVYYENNGNISYKKIFNQKIWEGKKVEELLLDLIAMNPKSKEDTIMEVSVWKALFKKSIFDKYNIKFESERKFISEDIIFDIDYISKVNKVIMLPNPIYYYSVNPNSLSKTFRIDRFEKVKVLYNEIRRKLNLLYDEDIVNERCDRFLLARARTNIKQIIKHKKIIGNIEVNKGLDIICNDSDLKIILNRYPVYDLPIKYMFVALCIKYKIYFILKILFIRW